MTGPKSIPINIGHNALYLNMDEKPSLNTATINLVSEDGAVKVSVPKAHFPFIAPGQSVIATIVLTRVSIEAAPAAPSLILPPGTPTQ